MSMILQPPGLPAQHHAPNLPSMAPPIKNVDAPPFKVTKKIYCIKKRPPPRTLHICFNFQEKMWVYGGYDSLIGVLSDLWYIPITYPIDENLSWQKVEITGDEFPKTFRHAGQLMDNTLYLLGGKLSASINCSQLWALNLTEEPIKWQQLEFIKKDKDDIGSQPIDSSTVIGYDNLVWMFGGFIGGSTASYTNCLWTFNPKTTQLKLVDPQSIQGKLPDPRVDHAATLIGDKMAIFGGSCENIEYDDLWIFHIKKMTFEQVVAPGVKPTPRAGHCMLVCNDNYLIVFGGKDEPLKAKTVQFNYNMTHGKWDGFTSDWVDVDEDYEDDTNKKSNRGKGSDQKKVRNIALGLAKGGNRSPTKMSRNNIGTLNNLGDNKLIKQGSKWNTNTDKMNPNSKRKLPRMSSRQSIKAEEGQPSRRDLEGESPMRNRGQSTNINTKDDDVNSAVSVMADSSQFDEANALKARSCSVIKKERITLKRENDKRKLLKEFEPGAKYKYMEFFDPDFQGMSAALKVLGMPTEKVKTTERGQPILTPGCSRFAGEIKSRAEYNDMPKLDGFTFMTKGWMLFIFGGDRCGLCTNDLYVIDLEEPLTGKEGEMARIEREAAEALKKKQEEEAAAERNKWQNQSGTSDDQMKQGNSPTKGKKDQRKNIGSRQAFSPTKSPTKKKMGTQKNIETMKDPNYANSRKNLDSPTKSPGRKQQNSSNSPKNRPVKMNTIMSRNNLEEEKSTSGQGEVVKPESVKAQSVKPESVKKDEEYQGEMNPVNRDEDDYGEMKPVKMDEGDIDIRRDEDQIGHSKVENDEKSVHCHNEKPDDNWIGDMKIQNDQPNEEEDWDLKIQNDEKAVEVSNGKKDDSDWEKEKSDDDWIGNLTAQVQQRTN